MAHVYRHVRLDNNEPFYIGISSDYNYNRAYSLAGRNKYWNNIVNKTDYRVDIVMDNLTWDEACEKEIELISLYGRKDFNIGPLVNKTNGGDGLCGVLVSSETRLKMSKSQSKRKFNPLSSETKYKISQSHIGKKFSKEHRDKIVKSNTGQIRVSMSGGNNSRARMVIDNNTGIYYDCIKDAAFAIGIKYKTLYAYLTDACKNKTNMSYLESL